MNLCTLSQQSLPSPYSELYSLLEAIDALISLELRNNTLTLHWSSSEEEDGDEKRRRRKNQVHEAYRRIFRSFSPVCHFHFSDIFLLWAHQVVVSEVGSRSPTIVGIDLRHTLFNLACYRLGFLPLNVQFDQHKECYPISFPYSWSNWLCASIEMEILTISQYRRRRRTPARWTKVDSSEDWARAFGVHLNSVDLDKSTEMWGLGLFLLRPINNYSAYTTLSMHPLYLWEDWEMGLTKPISLFLLICLSLQCAPPFFERLSIVWAQATHSSFLLRTPPTVFWSCLLYKNQQWAHLAAHYPEFSLHHPFTIHTSFSISIVFFYFFYCFLHFN